ncbi:MAG: hypothetical protein ACI8PT_004037 [Gammaproteobacteria bacterium]|jgi:hypothetical protein
MDGFARPTALAVDMVRGVNRDQHNYLVLDVEIAPQPTNLTARGIQWRFRIEAIKWY